MARVEKIERMRRATLDRARGSRSRADGTDGDVVGCAPRAARAIRKCARREGDVRRAREGTGDDARRWDDARDSFASHREARARDRSVVSRRERARGVNGVRLESGGYLSRRQTLVRGRRRARARETTNDARWMREDGRCEKRRGRRERGVCDGWDVRASTARSTRDATRRARERLT